MLGRLVSLASVASALVAPPRSAWRRHRRLEATPAEVSVAATQQLLSLAAVTVAEGVWSTRYDGATLGKAFRYLGPNAAVAAALVASSFSVSSGATDTMAPGLFASTAATLALCVNYGLRLGAEADVDEAAPPKEAVGLMFFFAFFGFATAFQSLFAAGVLDNPFAVLTGVPDSFPDMSEGAVPAIQEEL